MSASNRGTSPRRDAKSHAAAPYVVVGDAIPDVWRGVRLLLAHLALACILAAICAKYPPDSTLTERAPVLVPLALITIGFFGWQWGVWRPLRIEITREALTVKGWTIRRIALRDVRAEVGIVPSDEGPIGYAVFVGARGGRSIVAIPAKSEEDAKREAARLMQVVTSLASTGMYRTMASAPVEDGENDHGRG
jgi:hypothetical protein